MNVLYFSTVNWKWIKQRPHFIAEGLAAKGWRVDYLSLNPLGKKKIKKFSQNNLTVDDTYVLPFSLKSKVISKLNQTFIQCKLNKNQYDVIILTHPLQYRYIPKSKLEHALVLYDCMDNMPFFYEGTLRKKILAEEKLMLMLVDGLIYSSEELGRIIFERYNGKLNSLPQKVVHNAVCKNTFINKSIDVHLKSPNILYIGTIDEWIDWSTVIHFASHNPEYTVYMIGPYSNLPKQLPTNIILKGPVPHIEVASYIKAGEIMIVPFIVNELTKAIDPVKIYEYISLNKKIVSSYWEELGRFGDEVKFYHDSPHFSRLIKEMELGNSHLKIEFIDQNNWDIRVNDYKRFIQSIYHKNNGKMGRK